MDEPAHLLQNEEIYFHTPGRRAAAFPYEVVAAGRAFAHVGEPLVRRRFNQHVLILTLGGLGYVEVEGRGFSAPPGTLAWLDTSLHYAHGCQPPADGWHYLWIGVQGFGLDALFGFTRARSNPTARVSQMPAMIGAFEAIIGRLSGRSNDIEPANSATVAQVIAWLVALRAPEDDDLQAAPLIDVVMQEVRNDLARPWHIADLSDLAALSDSQLHRRFLQSVGTTPMDWIRRERMNAAKRLLVQSQDQISGVAVKCGYPDPFHFSRDFRRVTGQSPMSFRRSRGS